MKKTCSMCGEPFEFELGPNGEIPDNIYHSEITLFEYWECPNCFQSSTENRTPTPKVKI